MTIPEKVFYGMGMWLTMLVCSAAIGLLLALPIKWTWNETMPYLFALPTITWGKAWCLNFLTGCLIKSSLIEGKKTKK